MATRHDTKRQKLSHQHADHNGILETSSFIPSAIGRPDRTVSSVRRIRMPKHDIQQLDEQKRFGHTSSIPNMVETQTVELLEDIRFEYEKSSETNDGVLRTLKVALDSIETKEPLTIAEASRHMYDTHAIRVPFPQRHPEGLDDFKLSVSRPMMVNVVGSYALQTLVRNQPRTSIDMVVCMPDVMFQEKDYLNYRYFYKRAYFLAHIAVVVKSCLDNTHDVLFSHLHGNTMLPILSLGPKAGIVIPTGLDIRIIPCVTENLFNPVRLWPDRNSLRYQSRHLAVSTPFYNASIRADSLYSSYLKLQHQTSRSTANFKNACALGRIWLNQRAFGGDIDEGGFGPFEWATLIALLLNTEESKQPSLLAKSHTSYQLFKGVLRYLAQTNVIKKPVVFGKSEFEPLSRRDPMFFDGRRGINLFFKMSNASYARLLYEVGISLTALDDVSFDGSLDTFKALFITKKRQDLVTYDSLFRLNESLEANHESLEVRNRFDCRVYDVLTEGLGDRVHLVNVQQSPGSTWSISAHYTRQYSSVLVGVIFNAMTINRTVDYGPSAEEQSSAAAFRQYWGPKAELRRFRDGSILESLLWSKDSTTPIFAQIVDFILARHFKTSATYVAPAASASLWWLRDSLTAFEQVVAQYGRFTKDLRSLDDLPLQVRRISQTDTGLSGPMADISQSNRGPQRLIPVDVLIEFEGTGRWPDDIIAIQRTKIALLLKISGSLRQAVKEVSAKLGIENPLQPMMNSGFLDVSYPSCPTFRLRIFCDREQVLLEHLIDDKSKDNNLREKATAALALVRQDCRKAPLHTQSMLSLCTRYPAFVETLQVVMYWFECHMLAEYLGRELIELIVAGVFLKPYPWSAPSSAISGLFRTLCFLSRWDWQSTPLIVDFSDRLDTDTVGYVNLQFQAWRAIDPSMQRTAIFAASDHDLQGLQLTSEAPPRMIAMRMTALSRSACAIINNLEISGNIGSIFKPSEDEYDFVIRLAHQSVYRDSAVGNIEGDQSKHGGAKDLVQVRVMENDQVSLFVKELRGIYATSIVFFYNCHQLCPFIGALWKPCVDNRTFRVSMSHNSRPSQPGVADATRAEVDVNRDPMLREICRLGSGLVCGIDIKT